MKNLTFLRTMLVLLLIAVPGLCWGQNALIVHDGTPGIEADALTNLTTHLTGQGFAVTPNVGVPGGSLATYREIWDIRFNNTTPLSATDVTAYTTYLVGGGSLFLDGENIGFATRNNSLLSFVQSLGGGTLTAVTPSNSETVLVPFNGPTPLTTVTFLAAAGVATSPGTGTFVTVDAAGMGAGIVFSPGRLPSAPAGTLIIVFDVNFLQGGADAPSQALTDNMISYLAAPTLLQHAPPTAVPTLSEWGMILLSVLMLASAALALRRKLRPLS